MTSGQKRQTLSDAPSVVDLVVFSPDGSTIASAGLKTIDVWDVKSGQKLHKLGGHTDIVEFIAFSPDGQTLASGSRDNTTKIWDVASGQQRSSFVGQSSWVYSVGFRQDGKFVFSGAGDGSVKIWNIASGQEAASLFALDGNEWAVTELSGRFDTNNLDGGAPLVWVAKSDPMRPLPLEMFMRDYYTPRLLARILDGETLPAIRPIAKITNRVQPEVAIVSVIASTQHPGRASVVVHAVSRTDSDGQRSGLQDLRLFRNGQMVGYREGSLNDGDFQFPDIQLPASGKTASFTAYAFNSERIKSPTTQKDYAYEPATAARSRAYLLQIGVNHYDASGCDLRFAANDAEHLSTILTEELKARGLDVTAIRLVSTDTETGAGKMEVKSALASIAASATPDDLFLLSFSGHGYSSPDGQFYILPSDVHGTCALPDKTLLKSAISADDLAEWLRPIDAGEMTFILDSCYSAKSVETNEFKPGPMGNRGLGQLAYDKRMRILAASQSDQTAGEYAALGDGEGLLTYVLADIGLGRGEADWRPIDKRITVGEWLAFGADRVPKEMENELALKESADAGRGFKSSGTTKRALQVPALFDFTKHDDFVVGTPPSK